MVCFVLLGCLVNAESFIIEKKKEKKTSLKKCKQEYAQEAGDLIKVVPKLQKHSAQVQKKVIEDLDDLLNNTDGSTVLTLTKEQLEARTKKLAHLTKQMHELDAQIKDMRAALG